MPRDDEEEQLSSDPQWVREAWLRLLTLCARHIVEKLRNETAIEQNVPKNRSTRRPRKNSGRDC